MYVDTVFGIKWRDALAPLDVILILIIVVLSLTIYILYKYNLKLKEEALKANLLFQFKIKKYGLTGLQRRIINHIVELQKLKDMQQIFTRPDLFEASVGDILTYMKDVMENGDSLVNVCKDLIITYEKLYHYTQVRKPIDSISDISPGVLLYFYLDPSVVYVGKLLHNEDTKMTLQVFRSHSVLPEIAIGAGYNFYFWRAGDAEYIFNSEVILYELGQVTIKTPSEFTRGKEVRRPYIDVLLQCSLILTDPLYRSTEVEEPKPIPSTILKINEHEVVMRQPEKLDFRYNYTLIFEIDEFKVKTLVKVIADKTIVEGNVHYYTCKIEEISEAAKEVLHKYLRESY